MKKITLIPPTAEDILQPKLEQSSILLDIAWRWA